MPAMSTTVIQLLVVQVSTFSEVSAIITNCKGNQSGSQPLVSRGDNESNYRGGGSRWGRLGHGSYPVPRCIAPKSQRVWMQTD